MDRYSQLYKLKDLEKQAESERVRLETDRKRWPNTEQQQIINIANTSMIDLLKKECEIFGV